MIEMYRGYVLLIYTLAIAGTGMIMQLPFLLINSCFLSGMQACLIW